MVTLVVISRHGQSVLHVVVPFPHMQTSSYLCVLLQSPNPVFVSLCFQPASQPAGSVSSQQNECYQVSVLFLLLQSCAR